MSEKNDNILSLADEIRERVPKRYAHCFFCKILYFDDVPLWGSVCCPKCQAWAVTRGITQEQVDAGEYDRRQHKVRDG